MSDLADSHSQLFLDMLTVALHFVKVSLNDSKNTNQTKENNAFKSKEPYSKEVFIKISQNNFLMIIIWDSLHHLTLIAHSSLSSELFNSDPFRWVKLCFPQKPFFRLYNGKNQQALYVENLSFDKSPAWNIQSSFHRGWFYLYQG